MPDNLIVRGFDDAIFVFNVKNHKSLFVEGTIANIVPLFLRNLDKRITRNYIRSIPSYYQAKAKKDIELVRKTVQDFLLESDNGKQTSLKEVSSPTEAVETPMQRLLTYAIKRWQIINASIELNYRCNLRCQCCYVGNTKNEGLQRQDLQIIAEQLRRASWQILICSTCKSRFMTLTIVSLIL